MQKRRIHVGQNPIGSLQFSLVIHYKEGRVEIRLTQGVLRLDLQPVLHST